jgi:predicted RNA binding protein YcfA (HicA-like mRNA interferase family)
MSVNRREVARHLEEHGFRLIREGGNHSIYSDGKRVVPLKRHSRIDRITANQICKQAGIPAKF